MDIYFSEQYGKLCERIEGGVCETYHYSSDAGEVKHMFIKRPISKLIHGVQYYDLVTPYGYGGPLVISAVEGQCQTLCKQFGEAFERYCMEHHIVSEFVRFHPVICNAKDFREIYHPVYLRKTLGTNLEAYEDPVQNEFTKSCRKKIRQELARGIRYRITEHPDNMDTFLEVYYATMKRKNAPEFYYFSKEYFDTALELLRSKILFVEAILEGKTIAACFDFIDHGIIHIHLSGTLNEYLHLSPEYILQYATTLWGKEHGYRLIHRGGGISNAPDDSLYSFKKKFSQNTEFDFYVGKKIWNNAIYEALCMETGSNRDSEYFPAYRRR